MKSPYQRDVKEVLASHPVDTSSGLTDLQVEQSRLTNGHNRLPADSGEPAISIFIKQFGGPLIPILIVAFVITLLVKEYVDATVIGITILLNTVLSFVQEYKAKEAIGALKHLTDPKATVIRNGETIMVESDQIVVGDILLLTEGMKITADARLVEAHGLRIDESVLTGESAQVEKSISVIESDVIINDQHNMVFSGTSVIRGDAVAVVIAVGAATEIGKIARDVASIQKGKTPLQESLDKLGTVLVVVIGLTSVVLFGVGILRGIEILEMFLFAVSLAVSAIPEGLIITLTIALAVGMTAMAKKKAIIRTLSAVETLGAVSVIATDKTGTLTENKLSVQRLFVHGSPISLGDKNNAFTSEVSQRLFQAIVLANNATINETSMLGDPLDVALLSWAKAQGVDISGIREQSRRESELPFSTEYRMMGVTVIAEDGGHYVFVKGGPREIIDRCQHELIEHKEVLLSDTVRTDLFTEVESMASFGLKPLAVAYSRVEVGRDIENIEELPTNLVFTGLVGFADPLRPETKDAVSAAYSAGIRVLMLTGDHRLTASQIAREVGIQNPEKVIKGSEIDSMSDEELQHALMTTNVYARVTPHHKMKIVRILQESGEVVAMTGDGVNDAPALANADIGVAMGEGGTDVARGASDMVILDNNFATIKAAIEGGRAVFMAIKKVVIYLLSTNVSELLLMIVALLAGYPLPLYPTQILWLNLITDGLPNLGFVFQSHDSKLMEQKPRDRMAFILDRRSVERLIVLGASMFLLGFGVFLYYVTTYDIAYARSATLIVLAFSQLFNVYNIQAGELSVFKTSVFDNKILTVTVTISALMQIAVIEVPMLQGLFRTVPINTTDWVILIALSFSIILVNELYRFVRSRPSQSLLQ